MSTGTTIGKGIWENKISRLSTNNYDKDLEKIKEFVEKNTKLRVAYISGSECIFGLTLHPKLED